MIGVPLPHTGPALALGRGGGTPLLFFLSTGLCWDESNGPRHRPVITRTQQVSTMLRRQCLIGAGLFSAKEKPRRSGAKDEKGNQRDLEEPRAHNISLNCVPQMSARKRGVNRSLATLCGSDPSDPTYSQSGRGPRRALPAMPGVLLVLR